MQLKNYPITFPENRIKFVDLFDKIDKICKNFMILLKFFRNSAGFKTSFDGLTQIYNLTQRKETRAYMSGV